MTAAGEAPAPRRRRRAAWVVAVLLLPFAVAATTLGAAGAFDVPPELVAQPVPSGAAAVVAERPDTEPGVIASPRPEDFDAADAVPAIKVILPPPPPPPPSAGGGSGGGSRGGGSTPYLLVLVNEERASRGLAPLQWSASMASSARSWSSTMAAHDDATPDELGDGLAHGGSGYRGQNVAFTYDSRGMSLGAAHSRVHAGWMNSSGHRANILSPHWSVMGGGAVQGENGAWYFTQNFG